MKCWGKWLHRIKIFFYYLLTCRFTIQMKLYLTIILSFVCFAATAQTQPDTAILFKPDRVFDGETMHPGWWVLVKGNHIESAGEPSAIAIPKPVKVISLPGMTLLPGLIEGHSHLFLHP